MGAYHCTVTRQLKKPRRAGEDKVLQTDAIGGGGRTGDKSGDFWYIVKTGRKLRDNHARRKVTRHTRQEKHKSASR
jgi:hypothetical protein